jgi:hypothetical protein
MKMNSELSMEATTNKLERSHAVTGEGRELEFNRER